VQASPVAKHQLNTLGATSLVEHNTRLSIYSEPSEIRRATSIICTIGPKTKSVEMLGQLFDAGMSVVRMNFSHGGYEYHGEVIANTREMVKQKATEGRIPSVAIALDTKGPEIRTGMTTSGGDVQITKGNKIVVTTDPAFADKVDENTVYLDYTNLPKMSSIGGLIFIDDGLLSLKVLEKSADLVSVTCEILNTGMLGSKKGVNLPEVDVDLPALSEKDKADLRFGVEQGVDIVFASFIRKASDIAEVRACLGEDGKDIKIIAKIENHEGVRNFDAILEATDGVMVARGDLGIEIPAEKVFIAQKMMIAKCNLAGKSIICATQMLESMTTNPRPTRAEVSDVSNAVLDGADCVMLSGETAKGAYPIEAVTMMSRICLEAESAQFCEGLYGGVRAFNARTALTVAQTTAHAAVAAANDNQSAAIIVLTHSGQTACQVAQYRPRCPILVVTRNEQTARQVHLYRGCYPVHYSSPKTGTWEEDVEARFQFAITHFKQRKQLNDGACCIGIQGSFEGAGHTNLMKMMMC